MSKPFVYLILGSYGSGRRNVLSDLIEFGADKDTTTRVFVSEADAGEDGFGLVTKSRESLVSRYSWADGALSIPDYSEEGDMRFVVADGRSDPAAFMDAFRAWFFDSEAELGRVITVMDCALCAAQSKAMAWYDCCIYFSDIILLNNRQGVSPKWVGEMQDKYKKTLCYPCTFEFVKKGRVRNPPMVLDTLPRRMTAIFDDPRDYLEDEEDDGDEEDLTFYDMSPEDAQKAFEGQAEAEASVIADPFLDKLPSGRRVKVLPDIRKLL